MGYLQCLVFFFLNSCVSFGCRGLISWLCPGNEEFTVIVLWLKISSAAAVISVLQKVLCAPRELSVLTTLCSCYLHVHLLASFLRVYGSSKNLDTFLLLLSNYLCQSITCLRKTRSHIAANPWPWDQNQMGDRWPNKAKLKMERR